MRQPNAKLAVVIENEQGIEHQGIRLPSNSMAKACVRQLASIGLFELNP